jgi:signal transduction histidine kinase/HD-like signal output (HDOD) protein
MTNPGTQTDARRAELVLHEIEELPTLPGVAARLMKVASAEDADLREIMRLIESDPTLTARVLSLCRRAELGLGSRVTTVERAVVLLGLEAVQSVVLSVQVIDWARQAEQTRESAAGGRSPAIPSAGAFNTEGFWRHSIATGCCAELLARKHKHLGVSPAEAFAGGLMHDLGKLALRLVLPSAYATIVELSLKRQANIADIEREMIGMDHHTAGRRLAERWELPDVYQDVMWLHGQDPGSIPKDRHAALVGLVSVADGMCRGLHLGWSGNHVPPAAIDQLCIPMGLELDRVESVLPALVEEVSSRCSDLGVSEEPTERLVVESLKSANRQLARLGETLARRARCVEDQARVIDALSMFHSAVENESGVREVLEAVTASAQTALGGGPVVAVHRGAPGEAWLVVERQAPRQRAVCSIVESGNSGEGRGGAMDETVIAERVGAVAALARTPGGGGRGVLRVPGGAGPVRGEEPQTLVFHANREEAERLGVKLLGPMVSGWQGVLVAARRYETARRTSEQLAESNRVLAQTRAELARAQSMARLGELTAGAAHEMNTPLAIISGRGQMLVQSLPDAKQKAAAAAVIGAAQRLAELIQRLHTIACPPEPKLGPVTIADVVHDAVSRAQVRTAKRRANGPVIPIRVKFGEINSQARLDRELMTQAVTELLINAIESGPREFVEVRVHAAKADDRLLIEVRDTGSGMSEHALAHAFDPFFSEKPAGRQPGLGLSLALRFVELHRGMIVLRSMKDDGTTARIELPDWRWQEAGLRAAA